MNLKLVLWTLPEVKVVEMIVTKGLGKIFRSGNNTVEAVKKRQFAGRTGTNIRLFGTQWCRKNYNNENADNT